MQHSQPGTVRWWPEVSARAGAISSRPQGCRISQKGPLACVESRSMLCTGLLQEANFAVNERTSHDSWQQAEQMKAVRVDRASEQAP